MDPVDALRLVSDLEALLPATTVAVAAQIAPRLAAARRRLAAGQPAERSLAECRLRLDEGVAMVTRRSATPLSITFPEALPVSGAKAEIQQAVRERGCLMLVGETGSGKTTQLPKMLLDLGLGRRGVIALTQPRRVAAQAVAARLREELATTEPAVAHSVRFDDRADPLTLVRVVTDGLLLAELARDPELSSCAAVIVDEAHERSLNIDLLLALLRRLRERRPDLIVAVSSASIEADRFACHLGSDGSPAPVITVGGRAFPVEMRWQPPADLDLGYLAATVVTIRELHDDAGAGDILAFLPTERDILEATRRLHDLAGATILPCFGRLSAGEQMRIFRPVRGRKVVLATNIAETSLTIPGIVYVIDAGLARVKRWHPGTRTERLPVEAVAQASCIQRAGRAGRVAPGVCVRLYSEEDFAGRKPYAEPEILRANLAGVVLTALHLRLGDPEHLPWLDPPTPHAWEQARQLLEELGALDRESGSDVLTALGRRMAALPADPAVARILLAGLDEGVAHEACTIAAFLSVQEPRVRPLGSEAKADAAHRAFVHESGDIASVLTLWDEYGAQASNSKRERFCEAHFLGVRRMREWADVRHQLWHLVREGRRGVTVPAQGHAAGAWPLDAVHRAVLAGMLGNVLLYDREKRHYRAAGGREAHVHPGSALRSGKADDGKRAPAAPPWLVACEIVETTRLFARLCAPIDPEWVVQLAGTRVKRRHRDPQWHTQRQQAVCVETITWKGLPLRDGRMVAYDRVDPAAATRIFAEAMAGEAGETIGRTLPVLARNVGIVAQACGLRDRLRRPGLDVDPSWLAGFYRERLATASAAVASTDALRRELSARSESWLALDASSLVDATLLARAVRGAPTELGGFACTYRYRPGESDDGVTVTVPEARLAELDPVALGWLPTAWLAEVVEHAVKQLPKDARRHLHPLAESVTAITAELEPLAGRQPLALAIQQACIARCGPVPAPELGNLPDFLRPRLRLVGSDNTVIYEGREIGLALGQAALGNDPLRRQRAEHETRPAAEWPEAPRLPAPVPGGWLALMRDRAADGSIAARIAVFASESAARLWHDEGALALMEAALHDELERLAMAPLAAVRAQACERVLGARPGRFRRALAWSAAQSAGAGKAHDSVGFKAWCTAARAAVPSSHELDQLLDAVVTSTDRLRTRLKRGARGLAEAGAIRGVAGDLERLLTPGWESRLPWSGLRRMDQYLLAAERRLDLAQRDPGLAGRLAERVLQLSDEIDHALPDDPRLLQALGLRAAARQAAADLEEVVLALATPGATAAAGFAEKRLRDQLVELTKTVRQGRTAIAVTRDLLLDCRQRVQGVADATARQRWAEEIDRRIASHPDLSLGCDLAAQDAAARALRDRLRF